MSQLDSTGDSELLGAGASPRKIGGQPWGKRGKLSKGFAPAAGPSLIGCRLHIAASWLHLAANFEDFGLDFRCLRGVLNLTGLVLGSLGRTFGVWC